MAGVPDRRRRPPAVGLPKLFPELSLPAGSKVKVKGPAAASDPALESSRSPHALRSCAASAKRIVGVTTAALQET